MEYKDYYATLGVGKGASKEELQRSYRKLARKYHPDVNQDPEAEQKFKEINEAYEVLKDSDKRAKYDRFGSAWKQTQNTGAPPPGYEDLFSAFTSGGGSPGGGFSFGGEGFSSFFEMLFGGGPGQARGASPGWTAWDGGATGRPRSGSDHDARISLSLEEAARGGRREITLKDPATGKRKKLRINIPPGVGPGQRIRLAGQGGQGIGGGQRGDLYLRMEILPHPKFRLEGSDIFTTLPVTPWEAVLGAEARLSTLEGEVTVKTPPGSSTGRTIRLKGKGYPGTGDTRGDLFAELRIVVPENPSEEDRKLFEKLAETSEFKARVEAEK